MIHPRSLDALRGFCFCGGWGFVRFRESPETRKKWRSYFGAVRSPTPTNPAIVLPCRLVTVKPEVTA